MRIARTPLRITLGGGGTDLPGYYEKYGGFLISAAINKYIYLTCSRRPFDMKYWLSYSRLEVRDSVKEIEHELLKKSLEKYNFKTGIELHSIAELPGNTGLGSSGSFLVGVLTLLNSLDKREVTRKEVAELASAIEMKELNHACGKQDQYIAAFGGIISLTIDKSGAVDVENLALSPEVVRRLENNTLIFYTGVSRNADAILQQQTQSMKKNDKPVIERMMRIKEIGLEARKQLLNGDLDSFGRSLNEHWLLKKELQGEISNPSIDATYKAAMDTGALGGKLMGAGGGGFFMFYVPDEKQAAFRARMRQLGLAELNWRFNFAGCEVVFAN